ncbi:MAG TPA: hypothetical protein VE621_07950 [Bryobacteraceae bacterium]|nr:hypothetical protein [Bryobacteraceae bacterium]
MDRVVHKFTSFEEAEKADREFYASLTPNQRIEILLELMARYRGEGEAAERLERVATVVRREQS